MSCALWGGRFNPIFMADRESEAKRLIEAFRVDILISVGTSDKVKNFSKQYPHLPDLFMHNELFAYDGPGKKCVQLLDVHNALIRLRDHAELANVRDSDFRAFNWDGADPLSDVFLMQFGEYPDAAETGLDYRNAFFEALIARKRGPGCDRGS